MIENNPLTLIPKQVKAVAYLVLFLASLVFGIYQASDGDWLVFVGSLLTSLLGLTAASNVTDAKPGKHVAPEE